MKIVNRKTFLALPPGTVFAKYEPSCFGPLAIKGETWSDDFLASSDLAAAVDSNSSMELYEKLDEAVRTGCSLKMDFVSNVRDGCFDHDQLFAVWEEADVVALIERLLDCLTPTPFESAAEAQSMIKLMGLVSNPKSQHQPSISQPPSPGAQGENR